ISGQSWPSGRWEERNAKWGAVHLTKDEYIAVNASADPATWVLLPALILMPLARYPISSASTIAAVAVFTLSGWPGVIGTAATVLIACLAWRLLHKASFDLIVKAPMSAWRRRQQYRRRWASTMDRAGLGCRID